MGQYGTMFGGDMLPGSTGSTMGGGRLASANAVSAVDAGNGTLKAYDPTSMSMTTAPMPTYEGPSFNPAGMDARTGLPTYMTNWLAGGAQGTAPTDSGDAAGTLFKPDAGATLKESFKHDVGKPLTKVVTPVVDKGQDKPGTQPGTGTGGPSNLQMHGPWEGANQGPLVVNDQWNFQGGTSLPVATPALGSQNVSPYSQFTGPVWTDPKTGFIYSDSAGKNQMFIGGDKTKPFMGTKNPNTGLYY